MMELVLDGDVKEKQPERPGNYTLAEGLVNEFPYWNQQDGKYAIWSFWSSNWIVGHIDDLGKALGYIAVQFDSKVWPTQILDGFVYSDGSGGWLSASLNEVLFKDCKYKIHSLIWMMKYTCNCVQKSRQKIQAN